MEIPKGTIFCRGNRYWILMLDIRQEMPYTSFPLIPCTKNGEPLGEAPIYFGYPYLAAAILGQNPDLRCTQLGYTGLICFPFDAMEEIIRLHRTHRIRRMIRLEEIIRDCQWELDRLRGQQTYL